MVIACLTFALSFSKVQVWIMRIFIALAIILCLAELKIDKWRSTSDNVKYGLAMGSLFIMGVLWFVAKPNPSPGRYRYMPALHLTCAHAVGIICWMDPLMFNTWIPAPYVPAMWMLITMGFSLTSYFSAPRNTPVWLPLLEHTAWCLFAAYYAWIPTDSPTKDVYNVWPMRVWFISHLVALGLTVRVLLTHRSS